MGLGAGLAVAGWPEAGVPVAIIGAAFEKCAFTGSVPCAFVKGFSIGGVVTIDRYGNIYASPQLSWGKALTPFAGAELDLGTYGDKIRSSATDIPSEEKLGRFLSGTSFSFSSWFGPGRVYSPAADGDRMGSQVAFLTSLFSANWNLYSFKVAEIGAPWP
jgi:hypothetical protein